MRARLAHLNAELQETLSGMAVIQLFGREAARAGELRALSERYRHAQFRRMGLDTTLYAVAEAVGAIVVAALLWWGGVEILDGTLTFGVLVAFMQYTQRFYLPIRDASAKFSVMQAATVSAERVFALLDTPPEAGGTAVPVAEAVTTRSLTARDPGDIEAPDAGSGAPGRLVRLSRARERVGRRVTRRAGPGRHPGPSAACPFASRRASGSPSSAAPGRGRRPSPGS